VNLPATGIPLLDLSLRLLGQHVYLITLAVTVLENVFVAGSFTPGETTLLAAGFVASAAANDEISAFMLVGTAIIGSMIGSNISYGIGLRGGRPLLERYGARFAFGERRLKDAEGFFERHGSRTIVLARFAPGIKNFAYTIAGVTRMEVAVFEIYSLVGAVLYAGVMIALGFFFGSNFRMLLKVVHGAGWGFLIIAVLLAAWFGVNSVVSSRRRSRDLATLEHSAEGSADDRD
jgi:membrane-associated protein